MLVIILHKSIIYFHVMIGKYHSLKIKLASEHFLGNRFGISKDRPENE